MNAEVERIREALGILEQQQQRYIELAHKPFEDTTVAEHRELDELERHIDSRFTAKSVRTLLRIIDQQAAVVEAAGDAITYTREWMRAPLNIERHIIAARMLSEVQAKIEALKGAGDES